MADRAGRGPGRTLARVASPETLSLDPQSDVQRRAPCEHARQLATSRISVWNSALNHTGPGPDGAARTGLTVNSC
jgi:hypothetical protein